MRGLRITQATRSHYHPDYARAPLDEGAEESNPVLGDEQGGKDTSHEEDEGVKEGQNSKTPGRLEEQIDREPRSGPRSPVTRIGSDECDVLLHAGVPAECLALQRVPHPSWLRPGILYDERHQMNAIETKTAASITVAARNARRPERDGAKSNPRKKAVPNNGASRTRMGDKATSMLTGCVLRNRRYPKNAARPVAAMTNAVIEATCQNKRTGRRK